MEPGEMTSSCTWRMKGKIFLNLLSTTVHGQAGSQPESMNSLGKIYLISRGGKKGGGKIARKDSILVKQETGWKV